MVPIKKKSKNKYINKQNTIKSIAFVLPEHKTPMGIEGLSLACIKVGWWLMLEDSESYLNLLF